ncbi:MATE family efflux transporter [Marinimicrobium locisalis]|uniref:MATE family efflux transporter n=1 Tax=Marinimicrobium locisalis TaxID=546022 RepID=UPI0032218140
MTRSPNAAVEAPALPTFLRYVGASVTGLLALTGAALVDGIMVGKWLGADALAAVNLLIPLWTLLFGLVLMLAIGGSVVAGRYLGARRRRAASRVFSGCLWGAGVGGLALSLLATVWHEPILQLLAVPESLRPLIQPYFHIVLLGLAPQYLAVVLYYFLRTGGQPQRASRALVAGAMVNIILDVWLLAVLRWDIRAAALATVAAQLTQCLLLLYLFRRSSTPLQWTRVRPSLRRLRQFCGNGLSEFVNEVSAGLVLLVIHWLLSRQYGIAGVAGFALIHYGLLLNIMLAFAIAEVVHVLVSQNRGAGQWHRAHRFFRFGMVMALSSGIVLWGAIQWGSEPLSRWFFADAQAAVAQYAQAFWAVIGLVFWLTGANLVLSAWFTGLQQPGRSALIALSRSLLLPLLFLMLLSVQPGVSFLWSLPLAEAFTLVLALGMKVRQSSTGRLELAAK